VGGYLSATATVTPVVITMEGDLPTTATKLLTFRRHCEPQPFGLSNTQPDGHLQKDPRPLGLNQDINLLEPLNTVSTKNRNMGYI
jgi:hypothetical protein